MKGLREFILRGNLVDLAVAVVIGAAFGAVISALVKDLITPLIGAIGGKPDFSALSRLRMLQAREYRAQINGPLRRRPRR